MSQVDPSNEFVRDTEVLASPPLTGIWLILARTVWVTIFALVLTMYIVGFPSHFSDLGIVQEWWILRPEQIETLYSIGLTPSFRERYLGIIELTTGLIFLCVAAFIFWRRSNDWVVIAVSLLLTTYMVTELPFTSNLEHFSAAWRWLVNAVQAIGEVLSLIVFYFFPNGRYVPRWTRFLTVVYVGLVLIWLLNPELKFNVVYGETFNKTPLNSLLITLAWHVTSIYALGFRYRNTVNPILRQQMKWVVFGLIIGFTVSTARYAVDMSVREFGLIQDPRSQLIYDLLLYPIHWLLLTIVPISFGIAILRYRLWHIDVIIRRTLIYGLLTAIVFGIYMFVVGFLSILFQTNFNNFLISLISTGFIAVLFQPLHKRLQRAVNKLLYGDRKDPYAAIASVSHRLDTALTPHDVLPVVVQTIGESLQLPYVAIFLAKDIVQLSETPSTAPHHFILAAQYGVPINNPDNQESLLLKYRNITIGYLLIATHFGDGKLSKEDKKLLTTVAKQASITAYSVHLTTELQKAREQLVNTREEERQRLYFDLHDGLGSQLTGQNLILQKALKELRQNPDYADELIADSISKTKVAIVNLRQVISDLRPPALDELGLLTTIREHATEYHSNIEFIFDIPEVLPTLPPAIEVACYRIVQEAITNVVRHANASTCVIKLTVNNFIFLQICDDGSKKMQNYQPGVGLISMRTRAEELGGTFRIQPNAKQGTCIQVQIPIS